MKKIKINIYEKLRRQNNLTQYEIAKILRVGQQTISRIERGESLPSFNFLKQAHIKLGLDLNVAIRSSRKEFTWVEKE
tara:strand:+ start:29062 stop:29295 length:234 start_codon:yes stop_codon:yes gene_type:complete